MATFYSPWLTVNGTNVCRSVIEVTVTSDTETAATIKLVTKIQYGSLPQWPSPLDTSLSIATSINGSSSTATGTVSYVRGGTQTLNTRTLNITKTHAKQNIAVSGTVTLTYRGSSQQVAMTASGTQAVGIKASYAVKFNANGGESSGMPTSQTKWHGEALTLSSSVPTRPGCTFLGWNTKNDGSGTNYAPGATYSGNAAITLYAVWIGASVDNITVFRCLQDGTFDDENGTYGHVDASWTAIGTLAGTVTVTSRYKESSWVTVTLEGDATKNKAKRTDASGEVYATFGGTMIRNKAYQVQVTVTLQCTYNGETKTKTVTANAYIAVAYSTLEGFAGGRGVSMGKAAHRDGLDVAFEDIYFAGVPKHTSDKSLTGAANIITGNAGVTTITGASCVTWGRICMISITWKNVESISVPADGNIANVVVGTLLAGLRPAIITDAHSHGDSAGSADYRIEADGTIQLGGVNGTGSARTIAAGTTFNLFAQYILA